MKPDSTETTRLLEKAAEGDRPAFDELMARHRPALMSAVQMRLDPGLRRRIDPSDVVQESQIDVLRRLADFVARRPMPFGLWLRKTAHERLLKMRRQHVRAARRSVRRELHLPDQTSLEVAARIASSSGSPSQIVSRRQLVGLVREALDELDELDREVVLMRYMEKLTNVEIAQVLGINATAVSKRLGRALLRLQSALGNRGVGGCEQ
jgi:RNA polymerase sigma-70 factor (ECF subfamily)